jgi:hypothetical protein
MAIQFTKATKYESKLRLALIGPAGSGKTYTALNIGQHLGDNPKIALMDTEHGSASKYANLFEFDAVAPDSFSPTVYMDVIKAAEQGGYDVLILDSLSHAWAGKDGILEFVDRETARSRSRNAFSEGWRKASPLHNQLIDALLAADLHLIVTMRSKMAYELQENEKGKKVPVKIGLQPIQRDGMEYEFDVIGDLDQDNNLVVGKTRCPALAEQVYPKAGKDIADVLNAWLVGEKPPERPKPEPTPEPPPSNGGNDKKPPKAAPDRDAFFERVFTEIPYYNNVHHVVGAMKKMGLAYAPAAEETLFTRLDEYAKENANSEQGEPVQETLTDMVG